MLIKVFTMKGCPHCVNLKTKLKENNIDFIELDIDENEKMYDDFSKKVDNEFLPAIIVGKTAYVPEKSFKTIDQAVELVKKQVNQD
jgi:glutaredoxin